MKSATLTGGRSNKLQIRCRVVRVGKHVFEMCDSCRRPAHLTSTSVEGLLILNGWLSLIRSRVDQKTKLLLGRFAFSLRGQSLDGDMYCARLRDTCCIRFGGVAMTHPRHTTRQSIRQQNDAIEERGGNTTVVYATQCLRGARRTLGFCRGSASRDFGSMEGLRLCIRRVSESSVFYKGSRPQCFGSMEGLSCTC